MHRARCFLLSLACSSLCLGAPAFASIALQTLAGAAPDGTPLAASVLIELTPTGGDFAAGTGTASMRLVVENTSGLVPFGSGGRGNPVLTTLYFNLPKLCVPQSPGFFTHIIKIPVWDFLIEIFPCTVNTNR